MKFFWKLFLSIMISVLLCVCVGGALLIQANFQSSLTREQETEKRENGVVYQMMVRKLMRNPQFVYRNSEMYLDKIIRESAETLSEQLNISGIQVLHTDGTAIFPTSLGNVADENWIVPEQEKYVSCIDQEGQIYGLYGARLMEIGSRTYVVRTVHDVSGLYEEKAEQYGVFRTISFVLMAICCVTTLVISWLFLRPVRRLSAAADAISDGDYEVEIPVRGQDEISSLSKDFNQMAKKVKESMHEVEEHTRRQQRFTDNFAHELKTPLTSMIGYADMIRSKKLTDEQRIVYADRIVREGKRLEAMSMKLMELIVLKKQDFRLREVSVNAFFENIEETISHILEEKGIAFSVEAEEAAVRIEPDLMKTVVLNLIDNARKAVGGQGRIELTGKRVETAYHICVQDNGCGMEKSEVTKVTEAFYMADKARSRAGGGAGLGLFLCKEIVELHHGALRIDSRPGEGTTVTVTIGGEQHEG